jgi:hypothetical protein
LCGEVSLIIEERETAEIDKMFEWIVECSGELCGEVNRSHFIVGIAFQHLLYMRWVHTMLDEERHEHKILFDDGSAVPEWLRLQFESQVLGRRGYIWTARQPRPSRGRIWRLS